MPAIDRGGRLTIRQMWARFARARGDRRPSATISGQSSIVASIGVDHELDATCASHDRRLPVWCDPLPDRVFSAAALHLQLHQLPKDVRQRVRIEHAGRGKGFSYSARRAEGMAPSILEWSGRHVMVLRRLRRPNLRRTRRTSALNDPSRGNAGRYDMAGSDRAYVRQKRAAMGLAGARRRMPRDRPRRFQAVGPSVARDVA